MLTLYNSFTQQKEVFKPIHPGKISLYVCGITVYDDCHLGHARTMTCFDVMVRFLRSQKYTVTYVRNITDIDDKIIKRANERGVSIETLTSTYIQSMHEDIEALAILPPDKEPKATAHIESIIQLIQRLIDKDVAYVTDSQDVCFEVSRFPNYGQLSKKVIEDLLSGIRIDVEKEKRSPVDFVLWKAAKPNEPSWPSPWGPGRPGWHIECSAMAMEELGEHFDIHGGGLDLQFPHHDNEIAQSEAATDKKFANYWLHAGMLQVDNEKMSKSLGNFLTIKDVLTQHDAETIRYFLLSSHYRSPLNYSDETILNAKKALTRLYQTLEETPPQGENLDNTWHDRFVAAMNDDFNTPIALSILFQLSHEVNKTHDPVLAHTLQYLGSIIGLLEQTPEAFMQKGVDTKAIEALIAERLEAKKAKNWQRADAIRDELLLSGVVLADSAEGTRWRKG